MIELVILDWAGTTVDYGCFAPVKAFLETFEEFGLRPTLEEIRKPMGTLKRTHIEQMLNELRLKEQFVSIFERPATQNDIDIMLEVFTEKLMEELHQHTTINPYVLEVVEELHKQNIKIGTTTGYTQEMLNPVAESAKNQGYIPDFTVTPDDTDGQGRPYPYMIEKNLAHFNQTELTKVVKIGDTVSDILEGKNAGIYSVGVIEGSSVMGLSKEEYDALNETEKQSEIKRVYEVFEQAGADKIILNFSEVPSMLETLETVNV